MERVGPVLIAIASLLDVVAGAAWIATNATGGLAMAFAGGAMAATVLVYGGSWLTILHGDVGKRLMALGVVALVVHLAVSSAIGVLGIRPLVNGLLLMLAAGSGLALLPGAWRATGPRPPGGQ